MSISSAVPTPPQSLWMQPLLTGRRTGGGEAVKEGVEGEVRGHTTYSAQQLYSQST